MRQVCCAFLRKGTARGRTHRPGAAFRPSHSLLQGRETHSFALCRPATGVKHKVGPELLLSPRWRESTLTTGLSPLESLESHTTELHWHTVSLVPCSSRLLGQSAYAGHVSLSDWLRVWPRSLLRSELCDSGHRGRSAGLTAMLGSHLSGASLGNAHCKKVSTSSRLRNKGKGNRQVSKPQSLEFSTFLLLNLNLEVQRSGAVPEPVFLCTSRARASKHTCKTQQDHLLQVLGLATGR